MEEEVVVVGQWEEGERGEGLAEEHASHSGEKWGGKQAVSMVISPAFSPLRRRQQQQQQAVRGEPTGLFSQPAALLFV